MKGMKIVSFTFIWKDNDSGLQTNGFISNQNNKLFEFILMFWAIFYLFFVHFSTSCLFFRGSKICSDRSCDWTSLVERLYLTNVTSRLVVGRSVNPTNKQFVNVCKCCAAPRLPLIGFLFPNSSSRHGEKHIALQWYTTAAKQPIGLDCSLWKWATKADTLWNGFSGGLLRSRFCFADTHLYDYCVRLPWRGNVIMP